MIPNKLTPVEKVNGIYLKRDDLFTFAGVSGGKARSCLNVIVGKQPKGLVTAGSRFSPQINIVAHIAKYLGIPSIAHTPNGELSKDILEAKMLGCKIKQHYYGYNTVICKRAKDNAKKLVIFIYPLAWNVLRQ